MKSIQIELLNEKLVWVNALQYSLISVFLLFWYCLVWSIDLQSMSQMDFSYLPYTSMTACKYAFQILFQISN